MRVSVILNGFILKAYPAHIVGRFVNFPRKLSYRCALVYVIVIIPFKFVCIICGISTCICICVILIACDNKACGCALYNNGKFCSVICERIVDFIVYPLHTRERNLCFFDFPLKISECGIINQLIVNVIIYVGERCGVSACRGLFIVYVCNCNSVGYVNQHNAVRALVVYKRCSAVRPCNSGKRNFCLFYRKDSGHRQGNFIIIRIRSSKRCCYGVRSYGFTLAAVAYVKSCGKSSTDYYAVSIVVKRNGLILKRDTRHIKRRLLYRKSCRHSNGCFVVIGIIRSERSSYRVSSYVFALAAVTYVKSCGKSSADYYAVSIIVKRNGLILKRDTRHIKRRLSNAD